MVKVYSEFTKIHIIYLIWSINHITFLCEKVLSCDNILTYIPKTLITLIPIHYPVFNELPFAGNVQLEFFVATLYCYTSIPFCVKKYRVVIHCKSVRLNVNQFIFRHWHARIKIGYTYVVVVFQGHVFLHFLRASIRLLVKYLQFLSSWPFNKIAFVIFKGI